MNDNFNAEIKQERLAFEREKHRDNVALRQKEFDIRRTDQQLSLWRSPLFLAVIAATIGLLSNAVVALINGSYQRTFEREKAAATLSLEERKSEADRILEALKTGDPDKAAANLDLLVKTNLVKTERISIAAYLDGRKLGEGASLPAPIGTGTKSSLPLEIPSLIKLIPPDWRLAHKKRKAASTMTEEEWMRLRKGFSKLKNFKPEDTRSIEMIAQIYAQKAQFGNKFFLPWNRSYLRYIEVILQEIDPNITVPYWDWWSNSSVPSAFLSEEIIGVGNSLWESKRRLNTEEIPKKQDFDTILLRDDFWTMSTLLETTHNRIHVSIGGNMASLNYAGYDSLNLVVMASIDYIWFQWENDNPNKFPDIVDLGMEPFSLTVRDTIAKYSDTKSAKSGSRGFFSPSPHTTHHADPQWAVRTLWVNEIQLSLSEKWLFI